MEHQKLLPKKEMYHLEKAIDHIEEFRDNTEEEMYKRGGPEDTAIWYPGATPPKK